jgi:dTDP-4-dehydrorhamnose 3,5-epimerase
MKATRLAIPEVVLIEPRVFEDDRGFFFESFSQSRFAEAVDPSVSFVQDNHSRSRRGVLRGLHYQLAPHAQGKLVRVAVGEILDVAVDIRRSSPTFGRWVGEVLSAQNKHQMWVPAGFAHGFVTLSDTAEVLYKTTDTYAPDCEGSIIWNDADIGIDWGIDPALVELSAKDRTAPALRDAQLFD